MKQSANLKGWAGNTYMCEKIMAAFKISSCVREDHIYKDMWSLVLGEEMTCSRENDTIKILAVMKVSTIVGHFSGSISAASSLFLQKDGSSISCKVSSPRRYSSDLPQGGLEVPCLLTFST